MIPPLATALAMTFRAFSFLRPRCALAVGGVIVEPTGQVRTHLVLGDRRVTVAEVLASEVRA